MAAIPAITVALAPNTSGPNPFTVGGLTLASIDCPTELAIGTGEHKRAVLLPVGGGKVVHTTGFVPDLNTWKGVLHQPGIDKNVATLRRFNVDGKERLFTWRGEMYYGIVAAFKRNYRKGGNLCDWQLEVEITRAANGAFSPTAPRMSSDEQIGTLTDTANVSAAAIAAGTASQGAALQAMNSTFQVSLNAANIALLDVRPTATAPPSAISAAADAVASARTYAAILVAVLPTGGASYLSARQAVAALTVIGATLQSVQTQAVHQQQGGSLYELSATKYGDVSRAFDLLPLTGAASPFLHNALSIIPLLPLPQS